MDFQQLKEENPIDVVAQLLGLELSGDKQLRAPCPACQGDKLPARLVQER